jgi:hypothetical protein
MTVTLLVTLKFSLQAIHVLLWLHCTYLTNGVLINDDDVSRISEASCSPSVPVVFSLSDLRSLQQNVRKVNSRNACYTD